MMNKQINNLFEPKYIINNLMIIIGKMIILFKLV